MTYKDYKEALAKIADVSYANGLLQWDMEIYMPPQGGEIRSRQMATLAGIAHQYITAPELEHGVAALLTDTSISATEKANLSVTATDIAKRKKLPATHVEALSKAISDGFQAWQTARQQDDYSLFIPHLAKLVALKRQEAEYLGYTAHPYDALLNEFEPGTTSADVVKVFDELKPGLQNLINQIAAKPKPDNAFMHLHYPQAAQWGFGIDLLKQMGYNFEAGRQDLSAHPFTIAFNSHDVRVTTRVAEDDIAEMIWSCIHEGGHALYEQGLPFDSYGLPAAEAASLGIHESQSRFWENNIGRSLPYWEYNYPALQALFPDNLKNTSVTDFYKATNRVEPSLIRTAADELTYHFHIIIRFELELALLDGSLSVDDLPEAWNAKYKAYLGVDVPSDAMGVLQDVHWSHAGIGYFPTYTLGSLYAAQFYNAAAQALPNITSLISTGNLAPILQWLRTNIHPKGRTYTSAEICQTVTGQTLNPQAFLAYATAKYGALYGL